MTIQETIVTPLRPDVKDPRAAARQATRRARSAKENKGGRDIARAQSRILTGGNPPVENKTRIGRDGKERVLPEVSPCGIPWSVWPLAATTVGLMAVSLTHLSDGVTQLTAIPEWQAWAMAIGIDCMLISVALAQLTAPPEVKKDIAVVAHGMEAGTLVMSAGLNALAFTGGAFDAAHWAQIAFGCFVPAAISGATYILARMTRGAA
jgi:hypothetical protein